MDVANADVILMDSDSVLRTGSDSGLNRRGSARNSFAAHMLAANSDTLPTGTPTKLSGTHLAELVLSELSHVLWQQRDLVTQLVYRLEVQRLLLVNGHSDFIEFATSDVNDALDDVRRQEDFRTELLSDLSSIIGTRPDASLRELILAVPSPWDSILTEHHAAFLKLSAEAEEVSRINSDLLQRGINDIGDLLRSFGQEAESAYEARAGRHGGFANTPGEAVLVDRDA